MLYDVLELAQTLQIQVHNEAHAWLELHTYGTRADDHAAVNCIIDAATELQFICNGVTWSC